MLRLGLTFPELIQKARDHRADERILKNLETFNSIEEMLEKASPHDLSYFALRWASEIGDSNIMIDYVQDPVYAVYWVKNIGHLDIMIHRVTTSEAAYRWADIIQTHIDVMKLRVTDPDWITAWNHDYPGNKIKVRKRLYGKS